MENYFYAIWTPEIHQQNLNDVVQVVNIDQYDATTVLIHGPTNLKTGGRTGEGYMFYYCNSGPAWTLSGCSAVKKVKPEAGHKMVEGDSLDQDDD